MLMLTLFGCGKRNHTQIQNGAAFTESVSFRVTFVNDAAAADVWILPQTDKNLKSTVWGTATIAKLNAGEQREVRIAKPDDAEAFLIRILDGGHAYYAARDISLDDGCSIRFVSGDTMSDAVIEILDADGNVLHTQRAFVGALGAN